MNKLVCPHCGKKGIDLLQKMQLASQSVVPCQSCGNGIGVSNSIVLACLPPLVLINLSGYVESYIAKSFFWLLAAVVFVSIYFFLLPLQPRVLDSGKTLLQKSTLLWFYGVLLVAGASVSINFFPSHELTVFSAVIALVVTFPLVRKLWQRDPDAEQKMLVFAAGYAFIAVCHLLALSIALPALPVAMLGEEQTFRAKVLYKRSTHKVFSCRKSVELSAVGLFQKGNVCVSESNWQTLSTDDGVAVVVAHSWFGDFVRHVFVDEPAPRY